MTPKEKVETHKLRIHAEFEQQKNFLAEEKQRQLQKLEKEEREQLRILGETEAKLAQCCQALQELVSELERRTRGSELELLQVRRERLPLCSRGTEQKPELPGATVRANRNWSLEFFFFNKTNWNSDP